MRLFECTACRQPLYFEHINCESCGRPLGFLPSDLLLVALEGTDEAYHIVGDTTGRSFKACANAEIGRCNWLVPSDESSSFCRACRHNRTIPDLSAVDNLAFWRRIEVAKRRLIYSLLRLKLPLPDRQDHACGLAFDFLSPTTEAVMTGHLNGVITISLIEADDAAREKQRGLFGELYRTLLGHFRHEIAHFYWDQLVRDSTSIDEFRAIFGDERIDYAASLQRHHAAGPPANWRESYISAYASCHPWEDFAETWAHLLHIIDTLDTARAFGVRGNVPTPSETVAVAVDFDPYTASIDRLIEAWIPLTFALNAVNRSMGLTDLYPFVLSPAAILKMDFLHARIRGRTEVASSGDHDAKALKAVVASLRRSGPSP
jgi:hypothetical protein